MFSLFKKHSPRGKLRQPKAGETCPLLEAGKVYAVKAGLYTLTIIPTTHGVRVQTNSPNLGAYMASKESGNLIAHGKLNEGDLVGVDLYPVSPFTPTSRQPIT